MVLEKKILINGRYEQHELLASGGLSHIYLGWDYKDSHAVAIKRLRTEMKDAVEQETLNAHEVACLRAVQHENVMSLYASGEDELGHYQIMELITGPNLQSIIDSVMPAVSDFVELAGQALSGLNALHEKSVIHCDIKPDNIMLTLLSNGRVRIKIIDFGLARFDGFTEELNEAAREEIFGAPEFVSPELLEGKNPTMLSDIYALGHVLYYLLAGRPAFEKDLLNDILRAHLNEQPVSLLTLRPDISMDLSNWVHQFIERYPEARHPSAECALKELKNLRLSTHAEV
ncbi:MAG: serine/threonine-protein kinase [Blastochloris sp.]|nr:serine/threonine-protein kinase [Blastochloris sp.]